MRANTPKLEAGILALVACSFLLVVIDLAYGPHAYPHSVEPGGKRDRSVMAITMVETLRAFGVASIVLLGSRHMLGGKVAVAEALWMTVPYALALIGFELLQMATWAFFLFSGLNFYGAFFIMGFVAAMLVLAISVRSLVPDCDWLSVLPVVALAFGLGTFFTPVVLVSTALYLLVRWRMRASSLDRG
ncbi:MAG: hypothetical protein AAF689_09315 [Pseudomonadota bacterium]